MTFKQWFNHQKVQSNYQKRLKSASLGLWKFIIKQDFEVIFKRHNLSKMSIMDFNKEKQQ